MMHAIFVLVSVMVLGVSGDGHLDVVDMSWRLRINKTIYFPSYPEGYNSEAVWKSDHELHHGVWVEAHRFSMIIHVGTHMDAPCHFCEDCWRMHEIPFDKLRGPAAVINVTEQAEKDPNYEITVDDLKEWEEKNGKLPDGGFLLVNTGGQKRWLNYDQEEYWGPGFEDGVYDLPGFTVAAVQYILNNTMLQGVGMDWGVIDSGTSLNSNDSAYYLHAHKALLSDNRVLLEYVKNIELLPPTGYTVYLNPLNLYDTCGAPLRMIAVKDPDSAAPLVTLAPILFGLSLLAATLLP